MITASKLALARACPGHASLPHVDTPTVAAAAGTDRHADKEAAIDSGEIPDALEQRWPGLTWRAEVAYAYDLETGAARELGEGLHRDYSSARPSEICGTADAVGVSHDRLVVVDWKGYLEVERAAVNAQIHLGALAFARVLGRAQVDVAIVYEARPMDVAYLDALDLEAFAIEVKQIVETTRTSTALVEGEHCRWCPAFLAGCPLKRKLADEAASGELMMRAEALIPFATDADATRAYELAANVRTFLKRLDAALYARAKEAPIPLADGKVFGPHVKRGAETIDAAVAYDVIRAERGDETARAAVEWSTTKAQIKRALEIVVGKGGVAAAERKTLAEIRARGGATRRPDREVVEEYEAQAQLAEVGHE